MKLKLLISTAVFAVVSNAQIVMFTGFNADGTDGFAFFPVSSIAGGTSIFFEDNEWNGSAIGAGGAFNTGEGRITWTAPGGGVDAGVIVQVQGASATPSVNLGSVSGTVALGNSDEALYAYFGTAGSPTSFAGYIANEVAATAGSIANTGLVDGTSAFNITLDRDVGAYGGLRNNQTSFSEYQTQVYTLSNWTFGDGTGDQSGSFVPFSETAFTTVPEPSDYAALTGAGLIGFALWRRRAARKA